MRVTLMLLGHILDISLEPSGATTPAPECSSLDGGTTCSYPIGFTAHMPAPPEVPVPDRLLPWDPED